MDNLIPEPDPPPTAWQEPEEAQVEDTPADGGDTHEAAPANDGEDKPVIPDDEGPLDPDPDGLDVPDEDDLDDDEDVPGDDDDRDDYLNELDDED